MVTQKQIDQRRNELAEQRKKMSLFKSPIKTLRNFILVTIETFIYYLRYTLTHPIFLMIGVPFAIAYAIGCYYPGPHQEYIRQLETAALYVTWWMGLGIMSSVGLGTGMHTGLLFLFPHILKVSMAAQECSSTDFESYSDMWFSETDSTFVCNDDIQSTVMPSYYQILAKVFLPCMLWGAGTAIGEIPPYAISRAARLAGEANNEMDDMLNEKSMFAVFDRMKTWMVNFLETHGFWGVLLMSAWPNAFFDLCGMCCGHFLMPFWTFFGATFIGKALIKAPGQACFFVMLFTERWFVKFIEVVDKLIPDALDPCLRFIGKRCDVLLSEVLRESSQQFRKKNVKSSASLPKRIWGGVITVLILYFLVSCIDQFAKQRQARLDDEEIKSMEQELKRK